MTLKWKILGAWRNTGEDVELVIEARTAATAEAAACAHGVLVSTCEPVKADEAKELPTKKQRTRRGQKQTPGRASKTTAPAILAADAQGLTAIKGLVLRAPYWAEVARGEKTIEYRSWAVPKNYRGPLAICAAKEKSSGVFAGCAVCVVDLVDCVCVAPKDFEWKLENPRVIEPVPVAGRLGLMDLKIKANFDTEWDE